MLRRLLLLPLLAPLLAVLLVGALNPRPWVSLRLLTWSSAPLPLGAWMALVGAGGAALSAGATSLALRQGATPLGRQVRRRIGVERPEPWEQEEAFEPLQRQRGWRETPPAEWGSAGGTRAPGEPAPTVSVPFRVIRRGEAAASSAPAPAAASAAAAAASGWWHGPQRAPEAVPEPVPAGEDWGTMASDDW